MIVPISRHWLPVQDPGDECADVDPLEDRTHWTRRVMPYATQAIEAQLEAFAAASHVPYKLRRADCCVYAEVARGPQWPKFPLDRALTPEEARLYRLIYGHGYNPIPS